MASFAEVLQTLASIDGLARLDLMNDAGQVVATIENRPGSQGSFRVYHHVAQPRGVIDAEAAHEALELFVEHTADARDHPGKHPNIDRLFEIVERNLRLDVSVA
jgi:hypothetical protein